MFRHILMNYKKHKNNNKKFTNEKIVVYWYDLALLNGRIKEVMIGWEIMYEYVSKAKYKPYKEEIESIIKKVQRIMKTKYATTFRFELIGSAKRHLVTKIKDGNKGYDFDYNLILQKSNLWDNPQKLKEQFMRAFSMALKGTKYEEPENSTTSITAKVVDKKHSKIIISCDFAIIYYPDDLDKGYMYIKNWKKNNRYSFEERCLSKNADYKLQKILKYEQGWNFIRDEYIKLKNHNKDLNKKSFILYLESIHNVYNHIQQSIDEEDDNSFRTVNPFSFCSWASLGQLPNR